MAFTDDLEDKIRSTYWRILEKKHLGRDGKTLTCDSFRKIVEEIKFTINEGLRNGLGVLELTNNIIFKILKDNYFVYENHQMAALIGYIYLKRQGVEIKNYTFNGINGNSTLDEIKIITASW